MTIAQDANMEDFVFTIITWKTGQIVCLKWNQVDVHIIGTIEVISLLSFSSALNCYLEA